MLVPPVGTGLAFPPPPPGPQTPLPAGEKGIRDSLVIVDQLAFIVNVPNKTVVTAIIDTARPGGGIGTAGSLGRLAHQIAEYDRACLVCGGV